MENKKWDKHQACKTLGIPYRIYNDLHDENVLGSTELYHRYIHIRKDHADDDRVWIHELAHAMLHFRNFDVSAGADKRNNAIAELEADSVAYIICKTLHCEDRKDYLGYVTEFISRIPVEQQSPTLLDERMPKMLKVVDIILKAGGYYA